MTHLFGPSKECQKIFKNTRAWKNLPGELFCNGSHWDCFFRKGCILKALSRLRPKLFLLLCLLAVALCLNANNIRELFNPGRARNLALLLSARDDARSYLLEGKLKEALDRIAEAEKLLVEKAESENGKLEAAKAELLALKALVLTRMERGQEAIEILTSYLESSRSLDLRISLQLARLLENRGRFQLAQQRVAAALRVHPDSIKAQMLRARLLLHQGRYGEAVELYDRIQEKGEPTARLCTLRAVSLAGIGNTAEAKKLYEQARRLDPQNDVLACVHARFLLSEKDFSGAKRLALEVIARSAADTSSSPSIARREAKRIIWACDKMQSSAAAGRTDSGTRAATDSGTRAATDSGTRAATHSGTRAATDSGRSDGD